jgi:phosphate transport system permease protein
MANEGSIAREPTGAERGFDRGFRALTTAFAWLVIGVLFLVVWQITTKAIPAMQELGPGFITRGPSDAPKDKAGIFYEICGTLYSSVLGVGLGAVFGIAVAIFLTQDFIPPAAELFLKNVVELLAAIPSVVYGLWGIFVVIPTIRPAANWVHAKLGWLPIFDTRLSGPGLLPAAIVLAIMVLPTITAISRDSLGAVPGKLREAAFGLGATRWEAILGVILPTAARGVYGSIILAFGRALGETMALAMLVGNSSQIGWSVFAPSNTLAALLANRFPESTPAEVGPLMYAALVLLAITLVVNILGSWIVARSAVPAGGAR